METDTIKMKEMILNLTLEIIYLLTGEDYKPVKKSSGDCVAPSSSPHVSGRWSRAPGLITEPPPLSPIPDRNNKQKILDLTHKLLDLLTEEVPIRCQDVAVYFSMEEWEYVEGHKDLYQDMMEDQRPRTSPDGFGKKDENEELNSSSSSPSYRKHKVREDYGNVQGMTEQSDICSTEEVTTVTQEPSIKSEEKLWSDRGNHAKPKIQSPVHHTVCGSHFMEEPWTCNEGTITNTNIYTLIDPTPQYPFTHNKEEPVLYDGGNITHPNSYTPTDHTQQDPTTHIMEEPVLYDGGNITHPNSYTPTDHTQQNPTTHIEEEPVLYDGENLLDLNSYTPKDHIQYPTTHTEEPFSCSGGNLIGPNIYTPTDHTQQDTTHIKEEPASCDGENLIEPDIYTPTDHTQQDTTHIKEEPASCDGENLIEPNSYTSTDHIQHPTTHTEDPFSCSGGNLIDLNSYTPTDYTQQDPTTHIKEEPASHDEENLTEPNSYTPTDYTQYPTTHTEKPVSCSGGNLTESYFYSPTDHTQYIFPPVTKEPVLSNGGSLKDPNVYTPTDYTPYPTTHIKEETVSCHKENPVERDDHSPTDHRQQQPTTRIKEEHSEDVTETNSDTSKDLTLFPHVKTELVSSNGESLTDMDIPASADGTEQNPSTNTTYDPDGPSPTDHTQYPSMEEPEPSSPGRPVDKDVSEKRKKELEENYNDTTTSSRNYFCTIQQKTDSLEILYNCPECPECFTSNLDLAKHQIIHTVEMPFICSECGRCFGKKSDLFIHQVSHRDGKYFLCPHCDASFITQSSLSIHEKTHGQNNPQPCPECGKTFPTKKRLTRHRQIHSNERPFKCLECWDTFKRKAHLQRHQTIHQKAKQLLTCDRCGDHFRSEEELFQHKAVHGKSSDGRLSLTDIVEPPQHQGKHSRSKPFQSSVYKRLHNPKLPFQVYHRLHTLQCPECPASFNSKSSLRAHQKTHTSGPPMAAPEKEADLPRDSISSHHLEHLPQTSSERDNQSMDTTLKKQPYKIVRLLPCPLCGKCFSSYYYLSRHYSIHSQEKPSI